MRYLVVVITGVVTGLGALRPHVALAQNDADLATFLRVDELRKKVEKDPDPAKKQEWQERLAKVREKTAAETAKKDYDYNAHGHIELIRDLSKLRIRRSYADLLTMEWGGDFRQDQDKEVKDLKTATFSYTNDFENHFDTWTAQAALIWPFVFKTGVTPRGQFCMPLFGIMPSFTVNRFTTTEKGEDALGQAKIEDSETDEVVYRLGAFAQFDFTGNLFAVARANALWKTDTGHDSSEPGFEIEFEPLWQSKSNPAIGLGFLAVPQWAQREGFDANNPETHKHAWLGYQARLRARFLGGSVQDDGEGEEGPEYLRAGLTAELNLQPFIFERLSASVGYSFMPAISGPISQDFYLESSIGYTIFEDPTGDQKVTAELKYLWGAPDNEGEKVQDQLTASIGIIF